jgi:hypothetical protein
MELILPYLPNVQLGAKTPTTINDIVMCFVNQKISVNERANIVEIKGNEPISDFSLAGKYKNDQMSKVTLYGFALGAQGYTKDERDVKIMIRRTAAIKHYTENKDGYKVGSLTFNALINLLSSNQQNPNLIYDVFIDTNIGEEKEKRDYLVLGRQFQSEPILGVSTDRCKDSLVDKITEEIVPIFTDDQQTLLSNEDFFNEDGFVQMNSPDGKSTYYARLMESYAKMAEMIGEAIKN